MDYTPLTAELASPAYDGMEDDAIIAAINAKIVTQKLPIPGDTVKKFFIRQGILAKAQLYAEVVTNDASLRACCMTVRDSLLNNVFPIFELEDPVAKAEMDAMCGGLIAAGCMTVEQQETIYATANVDTSWVILNLSIPAISQPDLDNARDAP